MQAEGIWNAALGQLQMEMPREAFDTWVRDSVLLSYEDGEFMVGIGNAFARDWLEDRLTSKVKGILTGLIGRSSAVKFVVWQEGFAGAEPVQQSRQQLAPTDTDARYTFQSFVVGPENRLARAAAMAVAESPGLNYNPLFLYGGVGLGKTHLLKAIAQHCALTGQHARYVPSEQFTNDLVQAIQARSTENFRHRYRSVDVLLIDDIQFIIGKPSTQEEIFHTFNALHGEGRQLVLSSDRPPKSFAKLEERLLSRFEWGLTVAVRPLNYDTRLAILREKSKQRIDTELLGRIANAVTGSVRELEGALKKVMAFSEFLQTPATPSLVDSIVADYVCSCKRLSPDEVLVAVASEFGLGVEDLQGRIRAKRISLPRQVAMYLLREVTDASLPYIGEALGGRDHTTVMYGHQRISGLIENDERLRAQIHTIRATLEAARG
jgi:chromosomal replication initiator protein